MAEHVSSDSWKWRSAHSKGHRSVEANERQTHRKGSNTSKSNGAQIVSPEIESIVLYDRYLRSVDGESQEWTFLLCVTVFGGHALSWLATRWTQVFVRQLRLSDHPETQQGMPAFCPILHSKRTVQTAKSGENRQETILYIEYQRDHYFYSPTSHSFGLLAYPSDSKPPMSTLTTSTGISSDTELALAKEMYGRIHSTSPYLLGLWFLDEYWYYSLFTLFMLIVFECTTVFQRLRTLNEFRTMSIKPYSINVYRSGKWGEVMSDELVPGDLVSVLRTKEDSAVPCDLLLLRGTCIASEAMLSGESTPLLKESVELRSGDDRLDFLGDDRNSCLFGGTKILQVTPSSSDIVGDKLKTPDGGCLAIVLRTGLEPLRLFSCFSRSLQADTSGSKELNEPETLEIITDCVIIITSVVPPELPMELSMAVNASLVALSKYAIFCTEPFRIPSAGRVDVCCFDKTGTITGEDLMVEGVVGVDDTDLLKLAVGWSVNQGDTILPSSNDHSHRAVITIKRRFQFSSLLKRMSTVSTVVTPDRQSKTMVSVKEHRSYQNYDHRRSRTYENTYKYYTRRGSRVLALAYKFSDAVETLKMLADSSHRCIMITGDNPLTAVHVAKEVEIVDRECLVLDVRENSTDEKDLVWRTVDDQKSFQWMKAKLDRFSPNVWVYARFNLADITAKMADMEEDSEGPPKIKLGDASVRRHSHRSYQSFGSLDYYRQGRCTLVATTQMYKILASNCLISAYSLSVQYLDGVNETLLCDYHYYFLEPLACRKLSKERPQGSIFNTYVVATVLGQFICHLAALIYITRLCETTSPALLTVYLSSVSTFAVNFKVDRSEKISKKINHSLWLLGAAAVAFCGATNFVPEANGWLQLVDMPIPLVLLSNAIMYSDVYGFRRSDVSRIHRQILVLRCSSKGMVIKGIELHTDQNQIRLRNSKKSNQNKHR
ncbi:hypothetical protein H4Q26_015726 [Puccinia striiformis f. sp. tritici PST-130]|nr:hypothetical protein H4Q26_015726 [Puccinia striiformis f. sp. tritici PST-130]